MTAATATNFLDAFQFVESSNARAVPNHLLETKIYAKLSQNAAIKVSPPVVYFEGFEVGKPLTCKISLCNVAREVIRMHINPPQTKHFGVSYTKQMRLVPGMTLECTVEFLADEWRYFYDCIKIHCPGDENVVIPLHAYPTMDASDFPSQITFPATQLGTSRTKNIALRSKVPVDFEFELTLLQSDDAYAVEPISGVVPANGEMPIVLTFAPKTYSTALMELRLAVSQFNTKARTCRVTGHCIPNANRKGTEVEDVGMSSLRVTSPLDRTRIKKLQQSKVKEVSFQQQFSKPPKIEKDGLFFTDRLDTVHHISQVLIQTAGKMQLKELLAEQKTSNSRQLKETRFEQAVRKNVYEERQNQLRWQVNLGFVQMMAEEKVRVLAEREAEMQTYKIACGEPQVSTELRRHTSEKTLVRTIRSNFELPSDGIQFDTYSNNPWDIRHVACDRFAQAARKIIMRNRAKRNLSKLEDFVFEWRRRQMLGSKAKHPDPSNDGTEPTAIADTPIDDDMTDASALKKYSQVMSADKVTHTKYPYYVQPNTKDDMAPDALPEVISYPTEVETEVDVPYFDLKVPQRYHLLGYAPHDVHDAYGYVAPALAKQLRSGAMDEIISIDLPAKTVAEKAKDEMRLTAPSIQAASVRPLEGPQDRQLKQTVAETHIVELKPPAAIFSPVDYPPLHIFNATPGLQVFQAPVPYSEVDPDYDLCPLPRYATSGESAHASTQKKYLDKEETIKGIMSWKKFPSNSLISLANNPTLTGVWVPRWTDPFDADLLPLNVPSLQDGLAEEDILEYGDNEETAVDDKLYLTPEMISAQFPLIGARVAIAEEKESSESFPFGSKMPTTNMPVSNTGPVPRERREQELDYFLSKKSNKLGSKMQAKIDQYNALKHDPELVLK